MSDAAPAADAGVQILRDLPYAQASVGHGTEQPGSRTLTLDVYLPPPAITRRPGPALVLSHGGAYHRGSKDTDEFSQDGYHNTPVPAYCLRFAAKGYVAFSVGYRLTPERAAPQPQPIRRDRRIAQRDRIDYVRQLLGLPPASNDELLHGVEGAIADVAAAFRFVQAQAARWDIDPARIALGGFSAGAFSSIYAAYALRVPAAAVVSLSGGMDVEDAEHYLQPGQPPMLLLSSEFDLPGIAERTAALAARAEHVGLGLRRYEVPARPHFYERSAEAVLAQANQRGAPQRCSVESVIEDFLHVSLAGA